MGMKNPWTINDPASFHPFVRSKQTIPSSRPVLPSVWLRAAVKHGRRPPRQRRVACLRAVRSHTTLDAGGRASTSASRPPLQRTGSGSGKSIKNRAHDSIKERDPAQSGNGRRGLVRALGLERYEAAESARMALALKTCAISPAEDLEGWALPLSAIGVGCWWQSPPYAPKAPRLLLEWVMWVSIPCPINHHATPW
jgi:hypothetical protein